MPELQARWLITYDRFGVQIYWGSILTSSGTFVKAFASIYNWAGHILACHDKALCLKDRSVIFLLILSKTFLSRSIFWWIIFGQKHVTDDFGVRRHVHERQWNWLWLILHTLFIDLFYNITGSITAYVGVVRACARSLLIQYVRPSAPSDGLINLLL